MAVLCVSMQKHTRVAVCLEVVECSDCSIVPADTAANCKYRFPLVALGLHGSQHLLDGYRG